MSDYCYSVVLPERPHSRWDSGAMYSDCTKFKKLGHIHFSGIAHSYHLCVWQDEITKQIFWAELNDTDGDSMPGWNEWNNYGWWVLFPAKLEQFKHYILGFGCHYGCEYLEDRQHLIKEVEEAIKTSPSDDQIDAYIRHLKYPNEKTAHVQWWKDEECKCPDCGIDIEVDATLLDAYESGCVYCNECANQRLGVEND